MAQDSFINATVDPAMAKKPDNADHRHNISHGTAAASDVSLSWDSAKVTTHSQLRSVVAQFLFIAQSRLK